ncbi:MAG: cysteine--tRNA ligase [Nitrospirae bacterium RBG_16_43_11]|nr:MAG: cysteine--tRNA ligase [Nitrospirae bacterium RBG_16_43_11]
MIKIYNTLTGKKEVFEPLVSGHVGIYVCGVTVYDVCHIGHARSSLVFDVVRRYLEYKGFNVLFVKNFTDIDDKIIARAQKDGVEWKDVAEKYIEEYYIDMELLGVRKADIEPKATNHIEEMQKIIAALMEKGYAYAIDGDVYYRVKNFTEYGKLSKRDIEEMLAGARVEIDERKEDSLDFALWKSSKAGEPSWSSPWGGGRPGWHIECSAMSMKYLGYTFDIHGGGKDLIFPHHENEIAQSEASTGKTFARYWIHNGFVNVNQEKMSKSLGNFFTIREVFDKYPYSSQVTAEVLRYFLISNHYRSPVDFSDFGMNTSHATLDGFYAMLQKVEEISWGGVTESSVDLDVMAEIEECKKEFVDAMDDDFNTAAAIGSLQKLRREVNTNIEHGISPNIAREILDMFKTFGTILGLFSNDPFNWEFLKIISSELVLNLEWGASNVSASFSDMEIQNLVAEREDARRYKDWKRSDEIRKQLSEAGIILEDRPDGSTRVKR